MKKIIMIIPIVLIFIAGITAQPRFDMEARVQMLTDTLHLTTRQNQQLKVILTMQKEKMNELMESNDGDRMAFREEMMDLRKETNDKILIILSQQQKATYKELLQERKKRMNRRRRH